MIFGDVKLRRTRFVLESEKRQRKNKKTGKTESVPVYERFSYLAPVGYAMGPLRNKMRDAFRRIANGDKKVELVLHRYPQVHTVVGQMKAQFSNLKIQTGWTSDDPRNTLFVVQRMK